MNILTHCSDDSNLLSIEDALEQLTKDIQDSNETNGLKNTILNCFSVCFLFTSNLLKFHDIDTKLSNEIIYNLIKRPHTVNKMVRHFVSVSKFSEMV